MSDLDAELERLRRDARKKLEEEQELERKLAEHEAPPRPVAPVREDPPEIEEAPAEPARASEALEAAKAVARLTPKKYRQVTVGKVIAGLVGLLLLGFVIDKILMPLILFLLVLAVIAWFVQRALGSGKEPLDEDDP